MNRINKNRNCPGHLNGAVMTNGWMESGLLNPHFAVQSGNGFNPDVELLRVCETFSYLEKDEQTLSSSKSQRSGIFPLKNPG